MRFVQFAQKRTVGIVFERLPPTFLPLHHAKHRGRQVGSKVGTRYKNRKVGRSIRQVGTNLPACISCQPSSIPYQPSCLYYYILYIEGTEAGRLASKHYFKGREVGIQYQPTSFVDIIKQREVGWQSMRQKKRRKQIASSSVSCGHD